MLDFGTTQRPISLRAAKQIEIHERRFAEHDRAAKAEVQTMARIAENDLRHADESDGMMTARLRRFRGDQALRQVRYMLTGKRGKSATRNTRLMAFEFIYKKVKKSNAGFDGVRIPVDDIRQHLGVSRKQVFRVLADLENRTPHSSPGCKASAPGVIVRLGKREGVRFGVVLPESVIYQEELADSMSRSIEDALSKQSAGLTP